MAAPAANIEVLLVDDNADQLELAMMALAESCDPARIATARSGSEALDYLFGRNAWDGRDVRRQPKLVILDIRMSPMNGLDVLKAIRSDANTVWVPVVMLSASAEKDELDACYHAGANSVVRKTTDFDELRRKMKQVYGFWVTVNEANRNSRV